MLRLDHRDLKKIILIGDRILIQPSKENQKTASGLYLPQGIHQHEELYTGYVMKVGPGYPIPAVQDIDESWKEKRDEVTYVPIQPKPGDLAIYLQQRSHEMIFNKERYVVVPNSALILLIRDEDIHPK